MLLTQARRAARIGDEGDLVTMADQDRARWDPALTLEGTELITAALRQRRTGPYQLQAAIAAVHNQAARYTDTDWAKIAALRLAGAALAHTDGASRPRRGRDGSRSGARVGAAGRTS